MEHYALIAFTTIGTLSVIMSSFFLWKSLHAHDMTFILKYSTNIQTLALGVQIYIYDQFKFGLFSGFSTKGKT